MAARRRTDHGAISAGELRAFDTMAFKLTYSDGQESQHDDDTVWEIDDGVLKLGREKGKWSVYLSPSHWAVLELGGSSSGDEKSDKNEKSDKDEKSDNDEKSDKDDGDDEKKDADKKDDDKKDADKKDDD